MLEMAAVYFRQPY